MGKSSHQDAPFCHVSEVSGDYLNLPKLVQVFIIHLFLCSPSEIYVADVES